MLFVDDDQAEFAKRQEQRRARTRDDPDAPVGDLPPDLFASLRGEIGVPFGGRRAKAAMKAFHECLRQRDLGQQNQHLLSLFQRRCDRLEIDLGLAGTGHAFQQCRREAFRRHLATQGVGGGLLVARQVGGVVIRVGCRDDLGIGGSSISVNEPALTRPSTTDSETPAACARPERVQPRLSDARSRTRARAGVMRSGSASVLRRPGVDGSGSKAAGTRSTIRATMPGADSV